mgnify:CR=1 FL=1|jgi:transposase
MFAQYLEALVRKMKVKYKDKNIIVIMDNLTAHKCQLVKDIIKKYDKVKALFMPSTTPEFSPIENLFGRMKQKLRCMEFINKE